MANVVQLTVDDTSPEIVYTPFGDTFSTPNTLAGWNPYFSESGFAASQGQIGSGTSFHTTSLDGALFSLQWHGTNIQLIGNASQATYTITLDGTTQPSTSVVDNVLASFTDLSDTDHTLSLTAHISAMTDNPYIAFDKAIILVPDPNQTSDEVSSFQSLGDDEVSFIGKWSFHEQNQKGFASSFHQSTTAGDHATAMFRGIAFNLSGTTSPSSGTYSITLTSLNSTSDSSTITRTFSARSSFTQDNSLLFFAGGLNQSQVYSVDVRNVDGGFLALDVGGFAVLNRTTITFPPPMPQPIIPTPSVKTSASSSFPPGTIAALALSGILLFLLVSLVLFYIILWRPRTRRIRLERRASKRKDRESGEIVIIEQQKTSEEREGDVARAAILSGLRGAISEEPPMRDVEVYEAPSFRFSGLGKGKRKAGLRKSNTGSHPSRNFSVDEPSTGSPPDSGEQSDSRPANLVSTFSSFAQRWKQNRNRETSNTADLNTSPVAAHVIQSPLSSPPSTISNPLHICPDCQTIDSTADANENFSTGGSHDPPQIGRIPPTDSTETSDEIEYADADDNYVQDGNYGVSEGRSEADGSGGDGALEREQELESPQALTGNELGEDRPFLKVRESSPFRVDFPRHSLKSARASGSGPAKTRFSGVSRVRFRDNSAEDLKDGDDSDRNQPVPPLPQPTFQLTPPSTGTRPVGRPAVTSFLDLTGSPSGSVRTHSSSGSERHNRLPQRSRWSSTTFQSVRTDRSMATGNISQGDGGTPPSATSRLFPFRFSLHAPRILRYNPPLQVEPSGSQPRSSGSQVSPSQISERGINPLSEAASSPSPTHSVPTTISDLHFRHSDSDDASRTGSRRASSSSRLPPHPPLPGGFLEPRRHQRQRSSLSHVSSLLTNQPNIVQRVLGLQSQGAGEHARSPSGSGSASPNIMIPRRFRPS